MAYVSNLNIGLQPGTANTFFASWEFDDTYRSTTSTNTKTVSSIAVGKYVKIKSGATWYNGTPIDSWVFNDIWQIYELIGDRAVLNRNQSGSHRIMSPINVRNLSGLTSTSTSTNTVVKYNTLDHYEIKWSYDPGNGMWFTGNSTTTKDKNATYSPPENATRIMVSVTPVSTTFKQNNSDVHYWGGSKSNRILYISLAPPKTPSAPTVSIDGYTLIASLENIDDARASEMEFEVFSSDTKRYKTGKSKVWLRATKFKCYIEPGLPYKVRCCAVNGKNRSGWSNFSSIMETMPAPVSEITICKATSETSVRLDWVKSKVATSYDIEYTTNRKNFDTNDNTTTKTGITQCYREITGLESGEEYFFRVRAVNDKGTSSWSDVKSVIIGKVPAAPTTWSSSTTAIRGESVELYWVHNAEDNSSETYAQIELEINGIVQPLKTIQNTSTGDHIDDTKYYSLYTSNYIEGSVVKWRVRTRGILQTYSSWSVQRVVTVYAPPTLDFKMTTLSGIAISTLTSFPFRVYAKAGPSTQTPTGYHISIISNDIYETLDNLGNSKTVNKGDEIYSQYFDTSTYIDKNLSASDVNLDNGASYTLTCVASMDSGLTVEDSIQFDVLWEDKLYEPDAEVSVDEDTYTAYITPYCVDRMGKPIENVVLSVYRREYDGTYRELGTDIDSTSNMTITDPHPSLDYARYRIIATDIQTGAVSYYDTPGYPVNGIAVIIQWDDNWSNFDARAEDGEDIMEEKPWSGSMLKLPYNIDVTESTNLDVDLVEYIGRSNPVSYYGTQLGTAGSWSMQIPKEDKDTLYALRRLSIWMGDVYIREPSGLGYWAHISVSMSQTHCEVVIPVSITVRRVEGGI